LRSSANYCDGNSFGRLLRKKLRKKKNGKYLEITLPSRL